MCVAVEGKVLEVDRGHAVVSCRGARIRAASGLVPVEPGDCVMVHAGCIIQKVSAEEEGTFTDLSRILDEAGAY